MWTKFIKLLSSGLGLGYIPFASGTFGSLWGVALLFVLPPAHFLTITLLFTIVATAVADMAEKELHEKDSPKIVIDEVVGMLVAFCFVPLSLTNVIAGFLLFRLFDILKIFPARWAQNSLSGGLGIVMDDVIAGAQAGMVLYFANWVLPLS